MHLLRTLIIALLLISLSFASVANAALYSVKSNVKLYSQFLDANASPFDGNGEGRGVAIWHDNVLSIQTEVYLSVYCWLPPVDRCDANTPLDHYTLMLQAVLHYDDSSPSYAGVTQCVPTGHHASKLCDLFTENQAFVVDFYSGNDEIILTIPADPFYLAVRYISHGEISNGK